jgi:hypothetical protein
MYPEPATNQASVLETPKIVIDRVFLVFPPLVGYLVAILSFFHFGALEFVFCDFFSFFLNFNFSNQG